MVFSSIPVYLDPPNWHLQQANQQQGDGETEINPQLLPPMPPPPATVGGGGTGTGSIPVPGSIRPSSMSERARLAKLPQPEPGLKCPRCDSSNTKFCYFNNYSLTQPRHFCKTCRRYWTRGGALRNVPVGGGCRRNKRSKRSRSKSPATADRQSGGSNCSNSGTSSNGCAAHNILGHFPTPPPQLPFLPSLHQLSSFGSGDIGLTFGGIQNSLQGSRQGSHDLEFQIGSNSSGAGPMLSARFAEQLRLQQFPLLTAGLEPPEGLFQFENIEGLEPSSYTGEAVALQPAAAAFNSKTLESAQLATIKAED